MCETGTSLQVEFPNFNSNTTGDHSAAGADSTILGAWVEKGGVFTQMTFGGFTTGTILNGGRTLSDVVGLTYTTGDLIYIIVKINNPGFLLYGGGVGNTVLGEGMVLSASDIPYTPGDAIPLTAGALNLYSPCAIVAQTNKPTFAILGDSIGFGSQDTADITGNLGYVARSIGPTFGYINFSISGTQTSSFTAANSPKRMAIVNAYCTHVMSEYGINNMEIGGQTAAQVETGLQGIWALFPALRTYQCTLTPASTSTDSFKTLVNQTQRSYGADRITVNTYIRTAPSPLTAVFDPCTTAESSLNSGLYIVDGTNFKYTPDGLHPNAACIALIVSNNTIPISAFSWP